MAEDVIRQLPDSVANQIAAGEVIQRPASVIKELVENAIDAGADNIQIVLRDAGKTLIQVVDNGCGMSVTDARLAFERHATSKIRKADDLFALHTMGFRGEALPSIVAVSEVEMRTMRPDDSIGTKIVIKASDVVSQEPCVCTKGTNIMVKHLFYNFVARRRYLKKDAQELAHILHEFERLALVNTDVEFNLTHNDKLLHQLTRSPLKKRIGDLFGRSVEQNIIPVETSTTVVRISGFIGLPVAARRRNALQYFFVNGRNMKHPYFHRAVLNCYKDLISADAQPNYFISFEVDPERIDVNIHPQKYEIKFEDEQLIFQILTAAIKESLGQYNVAPSIDFAATDVPDIPPCDNSVPAPDAPVSDVFDPNYSPFDNPSDNRNIDPFGTMFSSPAEPLPEQHKMFGDFRPKPSAPIPSGLNSKQRSSAVRDWDKLYDAFMSGPAESPAGDPADPSGASALPEISLSSGLNSPSFANVAESHGFSQNLIQCKNRYIVSDSKSGLMFIDQHRAHTLVLFNSFIEKLASGHLSSQYLLIEEQVELDPALAAITADNLDRLAEIGFQAENSPSEPNIWSLKAIPSSLQPTNAAETFRCIVTDIAENLSDGGDADAHRRRLALTLARASALRGSIRLSHEEIEHLVTELFRLPAPGYTPDGLPVLRILPIENIVQMFQR